MSRDIRSFFAAMQAGASKKSPASKKVPEKVINIADSDNDIVEATPEADKVKKASKSKLKRRAVVISDSSDEDRKSPVKKKPIVKEKQSKEKLKPVNIDEMFAGKVVHQSKVKTPPPSPKKPKVEEKKHKKKKGISEEAAVHEDEAMQQVLLDLDEDDDLLERNLDILDKTIEEAYKEEKSNKINAIATSSKENSPENKEKMKKRQRVPEGDTPGGSKKQKLEHVDSGIDPDQERFEKKRYSAMLYQKYKNRGGPKHHGEKEYPKGKPNCLKNLTFLRTGVLDSLESEEFENIIKEHGGRVVHGVSRKVNYVVVGDDPGPSKLDKAASYNIKTISEDELLDLILTKSGLPAKYCTKSLEREQSEDLGIQSANETPTTSPKKSVANKTETPKKSPIKEEKTKKGINFKNLKDQKTDDRSQIRVAKDKTPIKSSKEKSPIKSDFKEKVYPKKELDPNKDMAWTEKYKPKSMSKIVGQQNDGSCMNKLKSWLLHWNENQRPEVRKKLIRPSPWAKNDNGAYFTCALLSGPPGVGKTTTATVVCNELGYDVVEFNASDTRSKKSLQAEVAQLLSTKSVAGFAQGGQKLDTKRVLLMDEVDGMAGNEDRGGIAELIQLIKNTKVPIIAMCNDRNHQKMRSLVNYCFDLKFNPPKMEQIRGAMMKICHDENVKISASALTEIINAAGCDMRQILNNLSMWTCQDKALDQQQAAKDAKSAIKDTVMGPWEVIRTVFTESMHKNMSISEKLRLFFYDYSLGPLFVQENYLKVTPNCPPKEAFKRVALAADAISFGDIIDNRIRSGNNWSLLDNEALFGSVLPGYYMSGQFTNRIDFPGWLGKNSTKNKMYRQLNELQNHTRACTSGNRTAMRLDYVPALRKVIINALKKGTDGVSEAVDVMKEYSLLREDLDNLIELRFSHDRNEYQEIDSKVKAAFTRCYNKEISLLPFAPQSGVEKKRSTAIFDENNYEENDDAESDKDEDDLSANTMIKVKTKNDKGKGDKSEKAGTSKKSTSKAKGTTTKGARATKKK